MAAVTGSSTPSLLEISLALIERRDGAVSRELLNP